MTNKIDLSLLGGVLEEYAPVKGSLITILQHTQEIYGYLPKEAIELISEKTGSHSSIFMPEPRRKAPTSL